MIMLERFVRDSGHRIGRVLLVSLLAVAGCGGEKCVTTTTQYTTTVSTVGYVGPTQGQPVARFDLTQDFINHTPYEACAQGPLQDVGVVRLTVTSLASTPLAIAYDVQGLNVDGVPVWFQPGVIQRINPKETLDMGEVTVSPTRVNLGAKVVLTSVTVLP
jgi:hypothetical protein